jgi:hypothetical protein
MKNMSANVLNNVLSIQYIEIDSGLALRTSQPIVPHVGFFDVELLHNKACSP